MKMMDGLLKIDKCLRMNKWTENRWWIFKRRMSGCLALNRNRNVYKNQWLDGRTDGRRMDGLMDSWTDGWMDGLMDG